MFSETLHVDDASIYTYSSDESSDTPATVQSHCNGNYHQIIVVSLDEFWISLMSSDDLEVCKSKFCPQQDDKSHAT